MAKSRLIPAAKAVLYINGRPYAQVTSFRWDSSTPTHAIYGLDSGEPHELAPMATKITGQLGLLRLVGDGGLEGAAIMPRFPEIPRAKYFTMALIERGTDTQLFRADRCIVQNQSWDVPVKGFITGTMSFEALDWSNEAASR